MEYRALGRTGMRVSLLGLGTVGFGRTEGLKNPRPTPLPSMAELKDLLALARDYGVNLIDTAPAYGVSEARLGELLVNNRQHWVLCTKVGETYTAGRSASRSAGQSTFDFSPEFTRRSVMSSLQRLATHYLDVVLVHSGGDDLDIIEQQGTLEVLEELKGEGHIRAFGISSKTEATTRFTVNRCDVVMATLNLRCRDEQGAIALAQSQGCGVLIKKPFDSGYAALDADERRRSLEFVAATAGVSCIVAGTTNPAHLRANVIALG